MSKPFPPRPTQPGILSTLLLLTILAAPTVSAQSSQGSRNVTLMGRAPVRAGGAVVAVALDQRRPFAYVAHERAISVVSTEHYGVVSSWASDAGGISDVIQFGDQGIALATERGIRLATVSDEGSLEPGRSVAVSGIRSLAGYRHSSGAAYVLAAGTGGISAIGDESAALIAVPEDVPGRERGAFGVYAAYDLATEQDRLYMAAAGGYFVFNISDIAAAELLTWVNSAAVQNGIGVQASPDATTIVTTTDYASAPVRIFDLRPALDGTISQVRTASGAWTANWRSHAERFQVRWPYVFVAARDQGFRMFNMRNVYEPYSTAWFRTAQPGAETGATDIDVRNSDGLVAVLDADTGLWLIQVEDFHGWDGRGWGVGNISAVQDWDQGPLGADQWRP